MITLTAILSLASAPLTAGPTFGLTKTGSFDSLAFDAGNHRVLAAHSGGKSLAVLDTVTGKVQEVETGEINGIAISTALNRYFVAGGDQELVVVDRKTLKVVGRTPLKGPGDLLVLDTKRNHVLVGHDDGTDLWAFDASSLKPVGTVAIEEAPEFVEYDRAADRIYQNIKSTDHLLVIDPAALKTVATWNTAPMKSPHGLALDLKAHKAYSVGRNGKLAVLDLKTGKVLKAIDVVAGVDQIAIDLGLGRVYCPGKGTMTVVSTKDGSVLGEVPLPNGARNIAVDPATHTVWMAQNDDQGSRLMSFKPGR